MKLRLSACLVALASAAPAAAQQAPPVEPPTVLESDADSVDRVIVTAMVPIPPVGDGAPYRTPDELADIRRLAQRNKAEPQADAMSFRTCRMKSVPPQRLSLTFPSLEALLDEEVAIAQRVIIEAERAEQATLAAEQSRRDAAERKVDMSVVEEAELKRQKAVLKLDEARLKYLEAGAAVADFQDFQRRGYVVVNWAGDPEAATEAGNPITWSDLDMRARKRRDAGYWLGAPQPEPHPGLRIQNVIAREQEGKKGPIVIVTGEIRNDRDKSADVPDLTVSAFDGQGFVLEAVAIGAGSARVPAKSVKAFAYELRKPPEALERIAVIFASGLRVPPRTRIERPEC
jgi:hypothetical protein